jgi:hypothetical protein
MKLTPSVDSSGLLAAPHSMKRVAALDYMYGSKRSLQRNVLAWTSVMLTNAATKEHGPGLPGMTYKWHGARPLSFRRQRQSVPGWIMVAFGAKADIVQRWREMARSRITQSGHLASAARARSQRMLKL